MPGAASTPFAILSVPLRLTSASLKRPIFKVSVPSEKSVISEAYPI